MSVLAMKTAATVLQEMMVKLHQVPEYKCISQSGPQHLALFEFECRAMGLVVTATAHSKKDAKQDVARRMLQELAARGYNVPPPYGLSQPPTRDTKKMSGTVPASTGDLQLDLRSVVLLKELCEEYNLPKAEYELVGDTGPAHARRFTIRAVLGPHERIATATTKKAARQAAAQQLYTYLRENLKQIINEYSQQDAVVSKTDKAFERYAEVRQESVWRPDLGMKMAMYHCTIFSHLDPKSSEMYSRVLSDTEKRKAALNAISSLSDTEAKRKEAFKTLTELIKEKNAEEADTSNAARDKEDIVVDYTNEETALPAIAQSIGLRVKYETLPTERGKLHVVELTPTMPEIALAGWSKLAVAAEALQFIRATLNAAEEYCAGLATATGNVADDLAAMMPISTVY